MNELDDMLAYLATELLGWETVSDSSGQLWYRHDGRPMRRVREYMLTGNGMLEIIEKMRERNQRFWLAYTKCYLKDNAMRDEYSVHFGSNKYTQITRRTLPEAVARAAYSALQEQP